MIDRKYGRDSGHRITIVSIAIIVVLMTGVLFAGCSASTVTVSGGDAVDFSLPDLDGNSIDIKDYRGSVVVLNFWATWCPPCRAEIPDFIAVYEGYKGKDVVFFGVSADDFSSLKDFAAEYGMTYPTLYDEDGDVHYSFKISAIPHTFILDRNGDEVFNQVGMMSKQQLENAIEGALR